MVQVPAGVNVSMPITNQIGSRYWGTIKVRTGDIINTEAPKKCHPYDGDDANAGALISEPQYSIRQ